MKGKQGNTIMYSIFCQTKNEALKAIAYG